VKNTNISLRSVVFSVQFGLNCYSLFRVCLSVAMEVLIMLQLPVTERYKLPPHHRKFISREYLTVSVKPILTNLSTAEYCSVNKDAISV